MLRMKWPMIHTWAPPKLDSGIPTSGGMTDTPLVASPKSSDTIQSFAAWSAAKVEAESALDSWAADDISCSDTAMASDSC